MAASIRIRLTAWYVAVLAISTLTVLGASWWLADRSVTEAADVGLRARIEGVRDFLENPATTLTPDDLRDEFEEYAELTRGEALLEVIDSTGMVLGQPSISGWAAMVAQDNAPGAPAAGVPHDRVIGRLPFRVASARVDAGDRSYRIRVAAPMGPAYQALDRFHRLLLLLLPGVLVLAGLGGYWISRRALAPVDRITHAVKAITVRNLDQRLDLPAADDELRRLASTFNDVLARLESAVRDIVRFTADASHELRTPVALVRTTAEVSLRHERTPGEYRAALAEVLEHAQGMSALVDDLLALARTDAGIDAQSETTFDLRELGSETGREVEAVAASRFVTLHVDLPECPLLVCGDRMSLRRVLVILLDNAVKYSPRAGTIRMAIRRDAQPAGGVAASIEVTDAGIGLDAEDARHLFERFYRGARARQYAPDGSGLGLAIARTIVERHKGTLTLEARPAEDGGGCRARVVLPLERARV